MLEKYHYQHLDIFATVERYTSTKLTLLRSGKQANGACPYPDCSGDDDGFIVLRELSTRNRHYYCRTCRRAGDIVKLVQDINGWEFKRTCEELDIKYWLKDDGSAAYNPKAGPKRAPVGEAWQQKEVAFLRWFYPGMMRYLGKTRSVAYLAARGISLEFAQQYGLGYIPPFADVNVEQLGAINVTIDDKEIELTREQKEWLLKRWEDRIIFPLQSPDGQGFIGRALKFWQEGMTEQEHRDLIDEYNAPLIAYNKAVEEENKKLPKDKQKRKKPLLNPYLKTYPAGYFHTEVLKTCSDITLVEGPFDGLACLAGGVFNVLATCGTALDASLIPVRICDATLAFDGDEKGQKAAAGAYKVLRRLGITTKVCNPPSDDKGKDWSERYRLHGKAGLAVLLNVEDSPEAFVCSICGIDLNTVDTSAYDLNGLAFCDCDENKNAYCSRQPELAAGDACVNGVKAGGSTL